jgi:hypothetical protein
MRSETLLYQHPPTPPSNGTEYQAGLHQIAQYNADRGFSFDDSAYGSPRTVAHEGIPSQGSRIDSGSGERLGLGIQYVRTPHGIVESIMLRQFQDSYGPATEYYQTGQYDGVSVSVVDYPHPRRRLTKTRTANLSSRRRRQDPPWTMNLRDGRHEVDGRLQPLVRQGEMGVRGQRRHPGPRRQRRTRPISP